MKKIAFFTESPFRGKYTKDFPNARTEIAWQIALEADHYPITQQPGEHYDYGVIILPKKNPSFNFSHLHESCDKLALMQEGPNWYWQDWPMDYQIQYLNLINSSDIDLLLCHNFADKHYYQGISNKPVYVFPSLMIPPSLPDSARSSIYSEKRKDAIIGGTMCSWYGGMDSFLVASEFDEKIFAPSMGRKAADEDLFEPVQYLPYLSWSRWMERLRNFKYGVHLMRTHAAGTFALNCAYYGIPCIGYKGLDTQEYLHPNTTVSVGDIEEAKKIAKRLKMDSTFYNSCSAISQGNYQKMYSPNKWLEHANFIFV